MRKIVFATFALLPLLAGVAQAQRPIRAYDDPAGETGAFAYPDWQQQWARLSRGQAPVAGTTVQPPTLGAPASQPGASPTQG